MQGDKLNSIDEYERFPNTTIEAWSPERQVALAAAIADRWLPVYEVFSAAEQWGFNVTSFDQPHSNGPYMRRLWGEGQQTGLQAQEAWQHILIWARHRPMTWDLEDQRKKQGLAYATPELGELLARKLTWISNGEPEYPWVTEIDASKWQIRLNDYPDDFMYGLVIEGKGIGDFHDWPETWRRK